MSTVTILDEEVEVLPIDIVVSKSDIKGDITYANPIFFKLSGYFKEELMDQPHSILRHPDMPKIVFKFLWEKLNNSEEVYAFVKNLTKEGKYYWVYAYVRPAFNPDGSFRNYVSTRKAVNPKAKEIISSVYNDLLEIENSQGVEASLKALIKVLEANDGSLETFNDVMAKLQNL